MLKVSCEKAHSLFKMLGLLLADFEAMARHFDKS